MKKHFASIVFAMLPLFAIAASPQDVLTETVTDGQIVNSRSLTANGVLTESTCMTAVSTPEGNSRQKCTIRQKKLSTAEARDLQSQMMASYSDFRQQAQDEAMAQNSSSLNKMASGTGLASSQSVKSTSLRSSVGSLTSHTSSTSSMQSQATMKMMAATTASAGTSFGSSASSSKSGTSNVATSSIAQRN